MGEDELRDAVIKAALHWYAINAFPSSMTERIMETLRLLEAVRPLFERERG